MSRLFDANELCNLLNETYDAKWLESYPQIENIFFEVRDLYEKNPERFPKANKTFLSLIYNLANPEKQPVAGFITGPGENCLSEDEVLTGFDFPLPDPRSSDAYLRLPLLWVAMQKYQHDVPKLRVLYCSLLFEQKMVLWKTAPLVAILPFANRGFSGQSLSQGIQRLG